MPITMHPVPFPPNDYISQDINPLAGEVVAIIVPANWAPAPISFYAGPDGNLAKQVRDATGALFQIQAVPDSIVQMPPGFLRGHHYLSLVSGSELEQVEQTASPLLQVIVRA